MRPLLLIPLVAFAGLVSVPSVQTAFAQREYPWCARTSANGHTGDCSFATFSQCRATVAGQAGDCIRNPRAAYGRFGYGARPPRY
jgi:hypothetical protein